MAEAEAEVFDTTRYESDPAALNAIVKIQAHWKGARHGKERRKQGRRDYG